MSTLTILYHNLLPSLSPIMEILGFFIITSIVGLTIINFFLDEKSWWVIIPSSAITGFFGFILFLGCLSYFFKGSGGILIILIISFNLFFQLLRFLEISF